MNKKPAQITASSGIIKETLNSVPSWAWRLIVILLAIAVLPMIISGIALFVSNSVQAIVESIRNIFGSFSIYGNDGLYSVIQLCLWLLAIIFLIKFFFKKRGH